MVTVEGTCLLAVGGSPNCDDDAAIAIVRGDAAEITTAASIPVSEHIWQHELVSRPGGAWLLVVDGDRVTATALASDGTPVGEPWIGAREMPADLLATTSWREGFAIAELARVGEAHGVRLRVSDGVHETITNDASRLTGQAAGPGSPDDAPRMLAHAFACSRPCSRPRNA